LIPFSEGSGRQEPPVPRCKWRKYGKRQLNNSQQSLALNEKERPYPLDQFQWQYDLGAMMVFSTPNLSMRLPAAEVESIPLVRRFCPWVGSQNLARRVGSPPMEITDPTSATRPTENWRDPYEAALLEYDPSKLPERIAVALETIHRRLLQLRETSSREEHDKIEDALRTLFSLQESRA
jgi:hypothetical protein